MGRFESEDESVKRAFEKSHSKVEHLKSEVSKEAEGPSFADEAFDEMKKRVLGQDTTDGSTSVKGLNQNEIRKGVDGLVALYKEHGDKLSGSQISNYMRERTKHVLAEISKDVPVTTDGSVPRAFDFQSNVELKKPQSAIEIAQENLGRNATKEWVEQYAECLLAANQRKDNLEIPDSFRKPGGVDATVLHEFILPAGIKIDIPGQTADGAIVYKLPHSFDKASGEDTHYDWPRGHMFETPEGSGGARGHTKDNVLVESEFGADQQKHLNWELWHQRGEHDQRVDLTAGKQLEISGIMHREPKLFKPWSIDVEQHLNLQEDGSLRESEFASRHLGIKDQKFFYFGKNGPGHDAGQVTFLGPDYQLQFAHLKGQRQWYGVTRNLDGKVEAANKADDAMLFPELNRPQ